MFSKDIEVPIDDLLNPLSQAKNSPKRTKTTNSTLLRPTSNHPHTSKVDNESDIASSMRVSVLSRSRPFRQPSTGTSSTANTNSPSIRDRDREVGSSASSIRSVVRSSAESYASAISNSTVGAMRAGGGGTGMSPARMIVRDTKAKDRPDSKLTPSVLTSPSILEPEVEEDRMEEVEGEGGEERGEYDDDESGQQQPTTTTTTPQRTNAKKVLITRASLASVASRSTISSLTDTASISSSARTLSSVSSARSQNTEIGRAHV